MNVIVLSSQSGHGWVQSGPVFKNKEAAENYIAEQLGRTTMMSSVYTYVIVNLLGLHLYQNEAA